MVKVTLPLINQQRSAFHSGNSFTSSCSSLGLQAANHSDATSYRHRIIYEMISLGSTVHRRTDLPFVVTIESVTPKVVKIVT